MGYREAIQWIADNDDTSWTSWTPVTHQEHVDHVSRLVSVLLVADIYQDGNAEKVASDVLRRVRARGRKDPWIKES
jgi:hypothetical protein